MLNKFLLVVSCLFLFSCNSTQRSGGAHNPDVRAIAPNDIPAFPLPPPQPSATDEIPPTYFERSKSLDDVNNILTKALDKCGYLRKSYFYVPDGFALVTQLEKINLDGSPKGDDERWVAETQVGSFSLKDYFKRLLKANPGFYRCIVFVVTDKYFHYSDTLATKNQANQWLIDGVNRLPAEIGQLGLNSNYAFNVLIYEFKKNENDTATNIVLPSPVMGKMQLTKSGFYRGL